MARAFLLSATLAFCTTGFVIGGEKTDTNKGEPVAVIRDAGWCLGDEARDGAGEFQVLLQVAQLQRAHRQAGLVAVVDRLGFLRSGGEKALRHVVLAGVAVVKLAPSAEPLSLPTETDHLFLDGRQLGEERARSILAQCLARHGPPPAAVDPAQPTRRELAAIRAHLQPFQAALTLAATERVAMR